MENQSQLRSVLLDQSGSNTLFDVKLRVQKQESNGLNRLRKMLERQLPSNRSSLACLPFGKPSTSLKCMIGGLVVFGSTNCWLRGCTGSSAKERMNIALRWSRTEQSKSLRKDKQTWCWKCCPSSIGSPNTKLIDGRGEQC